MWSSVPVNGLVVDGLERDGVAVGALEVELGAGGDDALAAGRVGCGAREGAGGGRLDGVALEDAVDLLQRPAERDGEHLRERLERFGVEAGDDAGEEVVAGARARGVEAGLQRERAPCVDLARIAAPVDGDRVAQVGRSRCSRLQAELESSPSSISDGSSVMR
jgi:hypothetical protein